MKNTEKLIETLKKNSNVRMGNENIGTDGVRYRYDHFELKYKDAANWLVNIFMKAAKENGEIAESRQFISEQKYSFNWARPSYRGQGNGKIHMAELIIID